MPKASFYFLCQSMLHTGGAEKQLLLAVRALTEEGFTCKIRTLGENEPEERLAPLVAAIVQAGGEEPKPFKLGELLRRPAAVYWSWGRRADTVLKLFKPACGGRLLCSIRDADFENMRRFRHFERAFNSRVDHYLSNSRLAAGHLSSIVPNVPGRTILLLNALTAWPERDVRAPQGDALQIGMLGNIQFLKKGYDVALALAERIIERKLNIRISIAGRDDSHGLLGREISRRGLGAIVRYAGRTNSPLDFLRGCDVYLMLSRYEGLPNALIEAMSLSLPCVSTRVGDIASFFENRRHLEILDSLDPDAALDAIGRIAANPAYAESLGAAARARCMELFSYERLKRELIGLAARCGLPPTAVAPRSWQPA